MIDRSMTAYKLVDEIEGPSVDVPLPVEMRGGLSRTILTPHPDPFQWVHLGQGPPEP
jgi:hypothetical protein